MPRLRIAVAALLLVALLPTGGHAQSLGEVRAERDRIQARLDEAADRLAQLETEQALLEEEQQDLTDRLAELSAEIERAGDRIAERVRALYMRGSADAIVLLLSGGDPAEALQRAVSVERLVTGDRIDTEAAANARTEARAVADRLEAGRQELADRYAEQAEVTRSLEADLERAVELERRLEDEERRRREAEARRAAAEAARRQSAARQQAEQSSSPGSAVVVGGGGKACPVAKPHSFSDTWGAPRSGGRRHKGTDILAPRGQTVVAIVSGTWDIRSRGRSAGNWGILRGTDGNTYYYMHLESHVVGDGARVEAGQQVATNGDTGNARGTPHVHFELHPGGGGAVNPYPTLRSICG